MPLRILVVDGNAPWVRSCFDAMPPEIRIDLLRVYSAPHYVRKKIGPWMDVFRWRKTGQRTREQTVLVPGWTRAYGASAAIVQSCVRFAMQSPSDEFAIVFTLPYYAAVARAFPAKPRYYLAHDPFRFFGWDVAQIDRLEKQLLDACDVNFAVSRALVEDLQKMTRRPVEYLPNAVTDSFINRLSEPIGQMPHDLAVLPRPIVGCIGQMNASYDWDLIAELADAMPEVTFVFIGSIFPEPDLIAARIRAVLSRPNVRHVGVKPHGELPGYLQHFDVCLNPLAVNEHNDRRSPLRLYDYLAGDRPILSTAIREANEHRPYLEIGYDAEECVRLLRAMFAPDYRIDIDGRGAYIRRNTWAQRANQMLQRIKAR